MVSQLGGTVDGLTMRTFPGPELLAPGHARRGRGAPRASISSQRDARRRRRRAGARVPPGFVRTGPTKAGHYLFWESGCVFVTPRRRGHARDPRRQRVRGDRAPRSRRGTTATAGCSYMNVVEDRPRGAGGRQRQRQPHQVPRHVVVPPGDRRRSGALPRRLGRRPHDGGLRRRREQRPRRCDRRRGHRDQRRQLRDRGERRDARHGRVHRGARRTR